MKKKKFSLSAVNAPKFFFLSLLPISCFDTGRRCLWLEKKRKSDHITMIRQEGWIIFWRDPTSIWLREAVTDDGNDYFCWGKKTESISHYCSQEKKKIMPWLLPYMRTKVPLSIAAKTARFFSLSISILVLRSIKNKGPSLVLREFCGLFLLPNTKSGDKNARSLTFSSLFSPL